MAACSCPGIYITCRFGAAEGTLSRYQRRTCLVTVTVGRLLAHYALATDGDLA